MDVKRTTLTLHKQDVRLGHLFKLKFYSYTEWRRIFQTQKHIQTHLLLSYGAQTYKRVRGFSYTASTLVWSSHSFSFFHSCTNTRCVYNSYTHIVHARKRILFGFDFLSSSCTPHATVTKYVVLVRK